MAAMPSSTPPRDSSGFLADRGEVSGSGGNGSDDTEIGADCGRGGVVSGGVVRGGVVNVGVVRVEVARGGVGPSGAVGGRVGRGGVGLLGEFSSSTTVLVRVGGASPGPRSA